MVEGRLSIDRLVELMADLHHAYPPDMDEARRAHTREKIATPGMVVSNVNAFTLFACGDTYHPTWIEPDARSVSSTALRINTGSMSAYVDGQGRLEKTFEGQRNDKDPGPAKVAFVKLAPLDPATVDIGASISCAGVCLTVIDRGGQAGDAWFAVEGSAETV